MLEMFWSMKECSFWEAGFVLLRHSQHADAIRMGPAPPS